MDAGRRRVAADGKGREGGGAQDYVRICHDIADHGNDYFDDGDSEGDSVCSESDGLEYEKRDTMIDDTLFGFFSKQAVKSLKWNFSDLCMDVSTSNKAKMNKHDGLSRSVFRRYSLKYFVQVIRKLTPQQRSVIAKFGFGCLLLLDLHDIPSQFASICHDIADHGNDYFDDGDSEGDSVCSESDGLEYEKRDTMIDDTLFGFFSKQAVKSLKWNFSDLCMDVSTSNKAKMNKHDGLSRSVFRRYSLKYFVQVIRKLTPQQRSVIAKFGFGCLLLLDLHDIPSQFASICHDIADHGNDYFDDGDSEGDSVCSESDGLEYEKRDTMIDDTLFGFFSKQAVKSLKWNFSDLCMDVSTSNKAKMNKHDGLSRSVFTRYSLKYFVQVIRKLTPQQRSVIAKFGFGCLLLLDLHDIPSQFASICHDIADHGNDYFDDGDSEGDSVCSESDGLEYEKRDTMIDDTLFGFFSKQAVKSLKWNFSDLCMDVSTSNKAKMNKHDGLSRSVFTRYSLKYFVQVIRKLTPQQRSVIAKFGFGCLLLLDLHDIPSQFASIWHDIADHGNDYFDDGDSEGDSVCSESDGLEYEKRDTMIDDTLFGFFSKQNIE
ncbi:hypothetical protein ACQ4PT_046584 [Festuca glaucescens]